MVVNERKDVKYLCEIKPEVKEKTDGFKINYLQRICCEMEEIVYSKNYLLMFKY